MIDTQPTCQRIDEHDILSRLPCGIVILNAQGVIIWINAAAQHMLGNDLVGIDWVWVIQNAFAPKADDGHEVSLVDGRRVHVAISSLETLPGELVMLTDITKTRDYEQNKANEGRLVEIGRMTAQLAHQIRTPLSSAILFTEHLSKAEAIKETKAQQWLTRLQDCHASIEQQIQDLLLFARGNLIEKKEINLLEWGEQLTKRIDALVEPNTVKVVVVKNFLVNTGFIHAEALTGAILNLLNNAIQAEATEIKLIIRADKQSLQLCVADNGNGMADDVKAQALTPFFTTKAKGTGLGLAVVEAVVQAHRGRVLIDSAPQMGCTVMIMLPL